MIRFPPRVHYALNGHGHVLRFLVGPRYTLVLGPPESNLYPMHNVVDAGLPEGLVPGDASAAAYVLPDLPYKPQRCSECKTKKKRCLLCRVIVPKPPSEPSP